MKKTMSKHQISREIYRNIYGKYPINPALDEKVKGEFDPIRRQVTRTIELFSKLFDFQYEPFKEDDFRHNGRYIHQTHIIVSAISQLVIVEVSLRFSQKPRQTNTQRTKIAGYIINRQWHKLSTDSLSLFFCPFLDIIKESNPDYVDDFKKIISNSSSINEQLLPYIQRLPSQLSNF